MVCDTFEGNSSPYVTKIIGMFFEFEGVPDSHKDWNSTTSKEILQFKI